MYLTIIFIVLIEILNIVYYKEAFWIRLLGHDGVGNVTNWCEAIDADTDRFIMEPANARSDYFFLFIGLYMIVLGIIDWNRLHGQNRTQSSDIFPTDEEVGVQLATLGEVPNTEVQPVTSTDIAQSNSGGNCCRSFTDLIFFNTDDEYQRNPLALYPYISVGNGVFNILHGLGSFLYHACECNTWFGSKADGAGMVAVIAFPLFYLIPHLFTTVGNESKVTCIRNNFLAITPICGQGTLWCLALVNTITPVTVFTWIATIDVALVLLIWSYYHYWHNKRNQVKHYLNIWILIVSLVLFGLAYLSWYLDMTKIWCFHHKYMTWLRGHALWHALCAVCLLLIYVYYRAERICY